VGVVQFSGGGGSGTGVVGPLPSRSAYPIGLQESTRMEVQVLHRLTGNGPNGVPISRGRDSARISSIPADLMHALVTSLYSTYVQWFAYVIKKLKLGQRH